MQIPASLFTPFWLVGLILIVGAGVWVLDGPREIILITLIVAVVLGVLDWLFTPSN